MPISPRDYNQMSQKASPPTPSIRNIPMAFVTGGLICTLGQALGNLYRYAGVPEELVSGAVSVSLIFLSVLLTGLKVYDRIARWAGAGTLVPITGFANAMSSAAIEFKSEGLILGLGARLFAIAGPVIVYGVSASVVYGLGLWLLSLAA